MVKVWFPFITNYSQVANLVVTVLASIAAYILTPIYYGRVYFAWLNVYYLSALFVCGFFYLFFKLCNNSSSTNPKKQRLEESFLGIIVCGIAAKVWIFVKWDADLLGLFYIFFTFNIIALFCYAPSHDAIGKFQLPYRQHSCSIYFGAIVHVVALVLGITIGWGYEKIWGIFVFQVYYSFFTTSFIDLCVAGLGGIEKYEKKQKATAPPEEVERNQLVKPATNSECPICAKQYSDDVIPRILTKCGHTICQECAGNLKGDTDRISCPTCRQETIVNGSVDTLPKNFTVLEMIRGNEIA